MIEEISEEILDLFGCPICHSPMKLEKNGIACTGKNCVVAFRIRESIIIAGGDL